MNKLCGLIVALLLVTFPAFAPAQVDVDKIEGRHAIVGKWKFESKKSSGPDSPHKGEVLVIAYEEPKLTIERTLTLKKETKSATMVLFTDKRGEKNNPFPFNPTQELSSTTEWQDNILIRLFNAEMRSSRAGRPGDILRMKESYELKDGGNILVVTTRALPGSRADIPDPLFLLGIVVKRVYRRVV